MIVSQFMHIVTLYGCVLSTSIYTLNWTELNWVRAHPNTVGSLRTKAGQLLRS